MFGKPNFWEKDFRFSQSDGKPAMFGNVIFSWILTNGTPYFEDFQVQLLHIGFENPYFVDLCIKINFSQLYALVHTDKTM